MSRREPTLRPIEDRDEEFLLRVFEEGHGQELRLLPLAPAQLSVLIQMQCQAQRLSYKAQRPQAGHLLISIAGHPAGHIWFAESSYELRILDIALLSEYRRQGIGTAVLRQFQKTAITSQRPLRLAVGKENAPALRLYRRLGFVELAACPLHIEMAFDPSGNQTDYERPKNGRESVAES